MPGIPPHLAATSLYLNTGLLTYQGQDALGTFKAHIMQERLHKNTHTNSHTHIHAQCHVYSCRIPSQFTMSAESPPNSHNTFYGKWAVWPRGA